MPNQLVRSLWLLAYLAVGQVDSLSLDPTNADSIKAAASAVAQGMMKYYTGNNPGDTPGLLPQPYYWWEAGGMFAHMVDYWYCELLRG